MIALSPGYLHSSFKLLEMVARRAHSLASLAASVPRIGLLPGVEVVNFAFSMGWVGSDEQGHAILTSTGTRMRDLPTASARFRQALVDYVGIVHPAWAHLAPRGRRETFAGLPIEVAQCFFEADLVNSTSADVVEWWDTLAARSRGQTSELTLAIGRQGERFSIEKERQRTGKDPKWQSIESALAGFDVLSVVSRTDSRKLQIEVKASTASPSSARFHLTRYEWETAQEAECHVFHVWALGEGTPRVAVLDRKDVGASIPRDTGEGKWESVVIPFIAFADRFQSSVKAPS